MYLHILLSALIGGLVNLDTYYIAQTMISRPLVISPILGLILGSISGFPQQGLQLGAVVGVILELIWMNTFQVGTAIPPNATISSIITTSLVCMSIIAQPLNSLEKLTFLILSICFGFIVGILSKWVEVFLYKNVNIALLHKLEDYVNAGKLQKIVLINWISIGIYFIITFLVLIVAITIGLFIVNSISCLLATKFDLIIILPLLLLFGCGITISVFGVRKNIIYFIAGFLLTTTLIFMKG
jgi:mannose/fructose/N-acetylgalactosamine-specific phosphotransferase system component IIC